MRLKIKFRIGLVAESSGAVTWRSFRTSRQLSAVIRTCNLLLLDSLYSTYGPLRTRYLLTVETPTKTWSNTLADTLTQNLIECTQAAPATRR